MIFRAQNCSQLLWSWCIWYICGAWIWSSTHTNHTRKVSHFLFFSGILLNHFRRQYSWLFVQTQILERDMFSTLLLFHHKMTMPGKVGNWGSWCLGNFVICREILLCKIKKFFKILWVIYLFIFIFIEIWAIFQRH